MTGSYVLHQAKTYFCIASQELVTLNFSLSTIYLLLISIELQRIDITVPDLKTQLLV
jgi:hypothetical protein